MDRSRIGCPDFQRLLKAERVSRRGFLQAGMLGTAGLTLSGLLREAKAAEAGEEDPRRANSVIILWMRGGPSQHETWDPKPDAPAEYRGEFGPIRTKVPGVIINEFLPLSAAMMDKWSIIRSLHHGESGHSVADQMCFTGYPGSPILQDANVFPSCGSIVAKQLQQQNATMPAYVVIPKNMPGTNSAYLGTKYGPFETLADPAKDSPFIVPNLGLPEGMSVERLDDRQALLKKMDKLKRAADRDGQFDAVDRFRQQAFGLLTSEAARKAFDLDSEPRSIRERYGLYPGYTVPTPDRCGCPAWSQRVLLARRLVEAGVRLVTVDVRWWDTHVKGFESLKDGFLTRWDHAYSALIEDLDQRGLLKTTMVVAWGEFGRTPRVNANAGRDHWGNIQVAALAGGGSKAGRWWGLRMTRGGGGGGSRRTVASIRPTCWRPSTGIWGLIRRSTTPIPPGRPHPVLSGGRTD